MKCPKCGSKDLMSQEYSWDSKEHYDGISEYHCTICGARIGRWTGNILKDGELEPRYGIIK